MKVPEVELKSLTVPHQGPAAHQSIPSQTPDCCIAQSAPWIAVMQSAEFGESVRFASVKDQSRLSAYRSNPLPTRQGNPSGQ